MLTLLTAELQQQAAASKTTADLRDMLKDGIVTQGQRQQMLGERLYTLVRIVDTERAGKITGMLLDKEEAELIELLLPEDLATGASAIADAVCEAQEVLREHEAALSSPPPSSSPLSEQHSSTALPSSPSTAAMCCLDAEVAALLRAMDGASDEQSEAWNVQLRDYLMMHALVTGVGGSHSGCEPQAAYHRAVEVVDMLLDKGTSYVMDVLQRDVLRSTLQEVERSCDEQATPLASDLPTGAIAIGTAAGTFAPDVVATVPHYAAPMQSMPPSMQSLPPPMSNTTPLTQGTTPRVSCTTHPSSGIQLPIPGMASLAIATAESASTPIPPPSIPHDAHVPQPTGEQSMAVDTTEEGTTKPLRYL